uniref:Uncharacterized protein n=1 Tax=Globodera pallida TaxID=36090 RepID=A0A183BXG7_GLOPA
MDIDPRSPGSPPVAPLLTLSFESSLPPGPLSPSSTDRTSADFVVTIDYTPPENLSAPGRPRVRPPSPFELNGPQKIEIITGVTGPVPPQPLNFLALISCYVPCSG